MVLALLTIGCAVAAWRSGGAGAEVGVGAGGQARAATPVLSVRRAPEALIDLVAQERLTARLDAALADPTLGGARDASCVVVADGEETVYARAAEAPLIPASTMKVLTGMAALTRLGTDTRFTTEVRTTAAPGGGIVDGDLWLIGSGDPLLATADYMATFRNQPQLYTPLEQLADAVVASGVRHVRGSVVGDESRYDRVRYVAEWPRNYILDGDIGPASALTVNDGFATYSRSRKVVSGAPARQAAAVFTDLLRARGVVVDGGPEVGRNEGRDVVVGSVTSAPMAEIVAAMIRESDNMTAELLVKELGLRFGDGGSWEEGLDVVRDTLADRGLKAEGMQAVDGSGLSRSDRLSCSVLMHSLEVVGRDGPIAQAFPVAGQTGTLAERFRGNPAAGRLRAKTGSLRGVSGLVGYVDAGAGRVLAFALLANDLPRNATGRALQEQVGAALVSYPEAPPPDDLDPLPPAPTNLRQ